MAEDLTVQETKAKSSLGKHKLLGGGREGPAIIVERARVSEEKQGRKESAGREKVYFFPGQKRGDENTLSGAILAQLNLMRERGKHRMSLFEEELGAALDLIAEVPGGGRELEYELGLMVGQMILKAGEEMGEESWEKAVLTLGDKKIEARGRIKIRENNPAIALVIDYLTMHGADWNGMTW